MTSTISYQIKTCTSCKTKKVLLDFAKDKTHKDGLRSTCKICQYEQRLLSKDKKKQTDKARIRPKISSHINAAKTAKYRATKRQATPFWSETKPIQALFKEAKRIEHETGIKQHVDHIVPQQSKLVCGLHVLANLRIISANENRSKSNTHWPDMS